MVIKHKVIKQKDIGGESVDPALVQTFLAELQISYPSVFEKPAFPTKQYSLELYQHRIHLINGSPPEPYGKKYPLDAYKLDELKY